VDGQPEPIATRFKRRARPGSIVKAVLALLLLSSAAAGCLSSSPGTAEPTLMERITAGLPPIDWDVHAQVDWWEDVATNYPKHDANLPTNAQLRQHLVSELRGLGLDVEVRAYPGAVQGQDLPDTGEATALYAIIGTKAGTAMPDHRFGLVAHYDSQTGTVQGAYDDMSGVAAQFSICKALAKLPMNRTMACIFFDGEERGLVASERYVQDVVKDGDEGYVYDLVLGYDMTGLNWPGYSTWKMYAMTGPADDVPALVPFAQGVLNGHLGYPTEGVEVLDVHDRNSDERNFKEAGVPILRFAGGRNAADYDQYHRPLDTVDHVYQLAGGRASFEKGFATVVEGSYATALAFDRTSMAELHATFG
jgi:hypothetical protein